MFWSFFIFVSIIILPHSYFNITILYLILCTYHNAIKLTILLIDWYVNTLNHYFAYILLVQCVRVSVNVYVSVRAAVGMYPHVKEAVERGDVLLEWDYSKGN